MFKSIFLSDIAGNSQWITTDKEQDALVDIIFIHLLYMTSNHNPTPPRARQSLLIPSPQLVFYPHQSNGKKKNWGQKRQEDARSYIKTQKSLSSAEGFEASGVRGLTDSICLIISALGMERREEIFFLSVGLPWRMWLLGPDGCWWSQTEGKKKKKAARLLARYGLPGE